MGRKPSIPIYTPVQPSVKLRHEGVLYNEIKPDVRLQDLIYCYWELKATQKLTEAYNYNVVADGCMDVFFELDNTQKSFVMGFSKTNTEFPLECAFNYIGIRFMPTAFTRLFKVKALEMSNRFETLDAVVPQLSQFIMHNISDTQAIEEIKTVLDNYFYEYVLGNDVEADKRFTGALSLIIQNKGLINIETDIDTGISPRQLRRMFEFYTGTNAKTFSKVVRFQNALNMAQGQSFLQDKLFYDAGYYDQAHFIKEFKALYGTTPGKALDK